MFEQLQAYTKAAPAAVIEAVAARFEPIEADVARLKTDVATSKSFINGEGLRTAAGTDRASGLRAGVRKPPKDERAGVASRYGNLAGGSSARRRCGLCGSAKPRRRLRRSERASIEVEIDGVVVRVGRDTDAGAVAAVIGALEAGS